MPKYIDVSPYDDCRIVCNSEDKGIPVKDIPAADVQEVRHGKWIDEPSVKIDAKRKRTVPIMIYKCSLCNTSNGRIKNALYCPNCGARMDESATDTNVGSRKE